MTMSKLERTTALSIAIGFILFNSGCGYLVLATVPVAREYYAAVEEAERQRKQREEELEKKLASIGSDTEYAEVRAKQARLEAARIAERYTAPVDTLDELERSLDALRAQSIKPGLEAQRDYERSEVFNDLYFTLRRLRSIRSSYGNYVAICAGNYFTAHRNESNIRRAVRELREMKSSLEPHKRDSDVSAVLKEIEETLECGERYVSTRPKSNYLPDARRPGMRKKMEARRAEKEKKRIEWWQRQLDRATSFEEKRRIRQDARLCGVSI